jgi:hypothetical protein
MASQRYIPQRHADVPPHIAGDSIFLEALPAPRLADVRGRGGPSSNEKKSHSQAEKPSASAGVQPSGASFFDASYARASIAPWQTPSGEVWPAPSFLSMPPPPPPPFGVPFPLPPGLGYPVPGHFWPHSSAEGYPAGFWPPPPLPGPVPFTAASADAAMPWLGPSRTDAAHFMVPQAPDEDRTDAAHFMVPQAPDEDEHKVSRARGSRSTGKSLSATDAETVAMRRQSQSASALEEAKIRNLVQRAKETFGLSQPSSSRGSSRSASSSVTPAAALVTAPQSVEKAAHITGPRQPASIAGDGPQEYGPSSARPFAAAGGGFSSMREARLVRINARRQSAVEEWKARRAATPRTKTAGPSRPPAVQASPRHQQTSSDSSYLGRRVAPAVGSAAAVEASACSPAAGRGVTVKNLKGSTPDLQHVLQKGLPSEQRRQKELHQVPVTPKASANPQRITGSYVPGVGSPAYEPFVRAASVDPKAAMYLEGIEALYKKLRESYVEFQRNPEHFLKAPAAAAIKKAVAGDTLDIVHDASHVRPGCAPLRVEFPANVQPSSETVKLRQELDRLEVQWQRLSNERGAGGDLSEFSSPTTTRQGVAERVQSMSLLAVSSDGSERPRGLAAGSFSPDAVLEFVRERQHQQP